MREILYGCEIIEINYYEFFFVLRTIFTAEAEELWIFIYTGEKFIKESRILVESEQKGKATKSSMKHTRNPPEGCAFSVNNFFPLLFFSLNLRSLLFLYFQMVSEDEHCGTFPRDLT